MYWAMIHESLAFITKKMFRQKIVNHFITFFCNIGPETAYQIDWLNDSDIELPAPNSTSRCTIWCGISRVDGINVKTLKIIAPCILLPLEYIFNRCIETSTWPDALKAAEVVPIYKNGDKLLCTNYMPISLVSNAAKIV